MVPINCLIYMYDFFIILFIHSTLKNIFFLVLLGSSTDCSLEKKFKVLGLRSRLIAGGKSQCILGKRLLQFDQIHFIEPSIVIVYDVLTTRQLIGQCRIFPNVISTDFTFFACLIYNDAYSIYCMI